MTNPGRDPDLVTPQPLRTSDDLEARAMAKASDDLPIPVGLQTRVRRALEDRLEGSLEPAPRSRAPRWAVVAAGVLVAGTAVAVGAVATLGSKPTVVEPPPAATRPSRTPAVAPPPAPVETVDVPVFQPSAGSPHPRKVRVPVAQATKAPLATNWPQSLQDGAPGAPVSETDAAKDPSKRQSPDATSQDFVLDWSDRRQARLSLRTEKAGETWRLAGMVNHTPVDLLVDRKTLTGHVGVHPVNLWMRGDGATGTLRGEDVTFFARPTKGGFLVRGEVPGHTVRAEFSSEGLSWYPGCEEILPQRSANVFQGRCARDRTARVQIPADLFKIPYLPRMILLGLLLTEREPEFDLDEPRLFPPLR